MEEQFRVEKRYTPETIIMDGFYYFEILENDYYPTGEQLVRLIGYFDKYAMWRSVVTSDPIFLRDLNNPRKVYEPGWTATPLY